MICSVEGCEKAADCRGLCAGHRYRLRVHGDTSGGGTAKGATKRFIAEVALPHSLDDCLAWPFSTLKSGYGKLWSGVRLVLAHRYVCEIAHGAPPPLAEAAHSCGNKRCVNPRHLRWATHADNESDKLRHGTRLTGQSVGTSKLTTEQVAEIRSSLPNVTHRELAARHGVSRSNIGMVINRKTWKGAA